VQKVRGLEGIELRTCLHWTGFGGGRAAFGGLPDDFRAGAGEQLHLPPAAEAPLISSFGFSSSHLRSANVTDISFQYFFCL
jgi:hypothetical protein